MAKRMDGVDREKSILDAGAKLAGKFGAVNVTRKMVGEAAKVSPALVAHYTGSALDAQKLYAKHAKKLKIEQPAKEKIEAIGLKMRAHGPRQVPVKRARAAKEVKAIKAAVAKRTVKVAKVVKAAKKSAPAVSAVKSVKSVKRAPTNKALPAPANKAKKKPATAARAPLPAPVMPPTAQVGPGDAVT